MEESARLPVLFSLCLSTIALTLALCCTLRSDTPARPKYEPHPSKPVACVELPGDPLGYLLEPCR